MSMMSSRFSQVASEVVQQLAELLCATVSIVDSRGSVVSSSGADFKNSACPPSNAQELSHFLRIPLQCEAEIGEVIVNSVPGQETISPRLAQALIELVVRQTTLGEQFPNQNDLKNQLINDLLHGQVLDEATVLSQARRLKIDLTPPRAVILIDASQYIRGETSGKERENFLSEKKRYQQRANVVISSIVSFFHLPSDTICADLGQGNIAVLKASDTKNLDLWASREEVTEGYSSSWANLAALKRAADALLVRLCRDTRTCVNIGIGRYHPGIHGLARSYEDARVALSLGCRFRGDNQVHCLGEMGIAAFVGVADENTKIDLARYLLSPLDHEPDLLVTLNQFFAENCCPSATAKRLSIHRNTLSYRLDKIASLTGLDARIFDDAVQMRLSLLLRSLQST